MLRLKAYAKVNLILKVLRKRSDGYHELETVFQEIALHDEIMLTGQPKKITFMADGIKVPSGSKNLAVRAALLLREKSGLQSAGAKIFLLKKIPTGAGLGGGSSDAACVLKGLNKLWRLNWPLKRLEGIASELGSDVAFFIRGRTALGRGRGEKLERLPSFPKSWLILAWPGFSVSTAWVYDHLKLCSRRLLPKAKSHAKLFALSLKNSNFAGLYNHFSNDLETVVFKKFPKIKKIKQMMMDYGAKTALLSGSGSMTFGFAQSKKQAQLIASKLKPLANKVWVTYTK